MNNYNAQTVNPEIAAIQAEAFRVAANSPEVVQSPRLSDEAVGKKAVAALPHEASGSMSPEQFVQYREVFERIGKLLDAYREEEVRLQRESANDQSQKKRKQRTLRTARKDDFTLAA